MLSVLQAFGDYEKVYIGLFENYLNIKFKHRNLDSVSNFFPFIHQIFLIYYQHIFFLKYNLFLMDINTLFADLSTYKCYIVFKSNITFNLAA